MVRLTKEQQTVIREVTKGNNVVINAVAGSGKTTTIVSLAERMHESVEILILCYNNRLRAETMEKIDLPNVQVHTFHSLCHQVFDEYLASTDLGILKVLNKYQAVDEIEHATRWQQCPQFDIIIVDEAQDMNDTYYEFVRRLLAHSAKDSSLVLVGDPMQSIYQFNGADSKYMIDPEKYFGRKFSRCTLSITFRMTSKICEFVNSCTTKDTTKITSGKRQGIHDKAPLVLISNPWEATRQVTDIIKRYLALENTGPEDIMILGHSIKKTSRKPIILLANSLIDSGIPVTLAGHEGTIMADDSILILSFHQAKGLERKFVIVLDFTEFYFKITGEPIELLPHPWYVAITRAKERLLIVHDIHVKFPFMKECMKLKYANMGDINEEEELTMMGSGKQVTAKSSLTATSPPRTLEDHIKYSPISILVNDITLPRNAIKFESTRNMWYMPDGIITDIAIKYVYRRYERPISPDTFLEEYNKNYCAGLKIPIEYDQYTITASWSDDMFTIQDMLNDLYRPISLITGQCSVCSKKVLESNNIILDDYLVDTAGNKYILTVSSGRYTFPMNVMYMIKYLFGTPGNTNVIDINSGTKWSWECTKVTK